MFSSLRAVALSAALLGLLDVATPAPAAERVHKRDDDFAIVVSALNPTPSMPREQVARMFLKKVSRWPSGEVALPVDLPADAPVRATFTRMVLVRTVASVRAYWQQRIFSGREVPPPEEASEADVLEYVRTHPSAIAYISRGTELPRGVRLLSITE